MKSTITYDKDGNARSFDGPDAIESYRLAALAVALRLYAKTGIRVNRAWTPTKMIAAANAATGCVFRRGQYTMAAEAVSAKQKEIKASCLTVQEA